MLLSGVLQALEERNKLRKKLGKNKILPQAQTSIDIKTKQVQSKPKESPDSWDIFTVEKKREEIIVDGEEIIGDEGKVEGDGDKIVGDGEKAGGDAAMCKLINKLLLFYFLYRYML